MGVAGPITTLSPKMSFFAIPTPPEVIMLPVEVEELAVIAEKFTAPVNVAPERAAYCERVAPLSAMILPVVPENSILAALPAFVTRLLTADVVAEPIREPDKCASLN